jgi:hypothetical protein
MSRVDPDTLAEMLGVDLDAAEERAKTNGEGKANDKKSRAGGNGWEQRPRLPVDLDQHPKVKAAIENVAEDRSEDISRIVAACVDSGLTIAHAYWAVAQRDDLIEKLDGYSHDDVAVLWEKITKSREQEKQHQGGTRQHLRDHLLRLTDLRQLKPPPPLIDGLLYRDTLAQIAGPPGSYKSFAAIAMSCCVAVGKSFCGFDVPAPGNVLYVAVEGASGLNARILAWCEAWGVDPEQLYERLTILPVPVQLGNAEVVGQAAEVVTEVEAEMMVLDTRARCTVGLEENSATQQGIAIEAAEEIRRAFACTVLGVHHSPRAGGAGRGSNAWDGAVWSDLRMEGKGLQAIIRCEKHKDVKSGCDHHFSLKRHTVSEELMPDVLPLWRETLVLDKHLDWSNLAANSKRVILEIVQNGAPPDGFTTKQIIQLTEPHGIARSTVYEAVKSLADEGYLKNARTENQPRWVMGDRES